MEKGVDKFSRLAALKPARAMPVRSPELRTPDETDPISRLLGGGIARNQYGDHLAIRNWFSTPEYVEPSAVVLDLLTRTPARRKKASGPNRNRRRDENQARRIRAALEDPEKWLFLDTETTGLAGGTGTYAFLIGLAWWDAGGLQVEQLFLRDFSEEHSLLQAVAERVAQRPVLVTFNGKSFDWPLLENRFTMTRAIRVPQLAAHLDLLHPARALWKLRLGSARLVDLERHVLDARHLGWHREDDVASSLIPQFYFDYLRGGTAKPLAGVVKHNQMDLRGLAALFGKLSSLLEARESGFAETNSIDLFGLSKFLDRRGEKGLAQSACTHALDSGLPAEFRPQATRELALMAKRQGNVEQAAALWHELAAHPEEAVHACEQLAMHYERHRRDFARAVEFTELGLKTLELQIASSRDPHARARNGRLEQRFMCRLKRLRHRIEGEADSRSVLLLASAAVAGSGTLKRRG